ncbi:MAG TPA: hypothetical protein VFP60_09625 [Pseudolabrys sp.]|nr:hypothetical protein [Pseudolabrys sp.]
MLLVFELLAALAVGFVLGRIWEIRQRMRADIERGHDIPVARL